MLGGARENYLFCFADPVGRDKASDDLRKKGRDKNEQHFALYHTKKTELRGSDPDTSRLACSGWAGTHAHTCIHTHAYTQPEREKLDEKKKRDSERERKKSRV